MVKCCVSGCRGAKGVTLFKFPASRKLRRKWEDAIKAIGPKSEGDSVCSRHFLTSELQLVRGKTRLKEAVVPSVFLVAGYKNQTTNSVPDDAQLEDDTRKQSLENDKFSNKEKSPDRVNSVEIEICPNIEELLEVELSTDEQVLPLEIETNSDKSKLTENEKSDRNEDNSSELEESAKNGNGGEISTPIKETSAEQEETSKKVTSQDNEKANLNGITESKENKHEYKARESAQAENLDSGKDGKDTNGDICDSNDVKEDDSIKTLQTSTEAAKSDKEKSVGSKKLNKKSSKTSTNNNKKTTPESIDEHQDIEELLTDYYIYQNNIHTIDDDVEAVEKEDKAPKGKDNKDADLPCHVDPVYIELPVDKESAGDCLMVMESVQVEIDPSTLIQEQDFEVEISVDLEEDDELEQKKEPISLLTSSDEDDVIIQEPKIDTVEVSDETDEDDMPLVKLVKKKKAKKKKRLSNQSDDNTIVWGMYYCVECHFRTTNKSEYNRHRLEHAKPVLIMCQLCGFMTSTEAQLAKHEKQHKDYKKYQCHLCTYKAKHKMSLVYHLKSHNVKNSYKCNKCSYKSTEEREALRHIVLCKGVDGKKYCCNKCDYRTKKPSDLRRHTMRKHKYSDDDEDDDDEYVP
ncbi:unnamed protein product [Chilo suppressalis]|uniref:THAP-type domain-containing protein n=1 Tax=Chilo suppressalis TaxID=168631 RepID=A0ABN8L9K5_CHISP|nr:unnamed protein product [Chilo suppressalis]